MFTNLASYLFGSQQQHVEDRAGSLANTRLTTGNADEDDWVLIDNSVDGDESGLSEEEEEEFERIPLYALEESWFLTPPPCFTSLGPVAVVTSPLENLLIEHPSMSVYHQRSAPLPPPLPLRHEPPAPQQHRPQRHRDNARAVQKMRLSRVSQGLKRNALQRCNNARDVASSRNKRQRRSDRQRQHSGANNNRKCC